MVPVPLINTEPLEQQLESQNSRSKKSLRVVNSSNDTNHIPLCRLHNPSCSGDVRNTEDQVISLGIPTHSKDLGFLWSCWLQGSQQHPSFVWIPCGPTLLSTRPSHHNLPIIISYNETIYIFKAESLSAIFLASGMQGTDSTLR